VGVGLGTGGAGRGDGDLSLLWAAVVRWGRRIMCPHPLERLDCIHRETTAGRCYRRSLCLDCGRTFCDRPEVCTLTGQRHVRYE
jgi:hypothetical protein